ncbi:MULTISPECIES: HNH endonuclease [Amycolatopsis]|uniref:HNH endonuclease n=1 Tax=Amycolatopsis TaxID=1813 RepID=UPI000B8B17C6|nr:hypothetical protein CF166_21020 [Amycolatopsis sp. KNN50.9b]
MAGSRVRCAYCSDSFASDVDHFRPIATFPQKAFDWENMIRVCTTCNRKKGERFPLGGDGEPRLIDPTTEDPWSHLTLDPQTGFIAPRYTLAGFDEFGEATLAILETINFEAATEARRKQARRLLGAMKFVLDDDDSRESRRELSIEVANDELGISRWYAHWEGSAEEFPIQLQAKYLLTWKAFVRKAAKTT